MPPKPQGGILNAPIVRVLFAAGMVIGVGAIGRAQYRASFERLVVAEMRRIEAEEKQQAAATASPTGATKLPSLK